MRYGTIHSPRSIPAISQYKSETDLSLETLNHLLLVAIIFVLVGVVMEGFEHVAEYKKHGWKPVVPKIGFVLLVIGLAAELALHPQMEQADNRIRPFYRI
jgi:H+/Cl- antiporter ClcA